MTMKLGRKTLEGYLVGIVGVIMVIVYLALKGIASGLNADTLYLGILIAILISVNILNAILLLRLLDKSVIIEKGQLKEILEGEG